MKPINKQIKDDVWEADGGKLPKLVYIMIINPLWEDFRIKDVIRPVIDNFRGKLRETIS